MARFGTGRLIPGVLAFTISSFMVGQALAQVTLPGSAEPGRNEEPVLGTPLEVRAEAAAAESTEPSGVVAETGATFVLKDVTVSGSTVFSAGDFEPLYDEYIGTTIDAGTVFAIAEKATALYRREGYILSQVIVPPQEVDGGVVQLRAVEGYVDTVVVEGEFGSQRGLVAAYAEKIKSSRPLNASALERYLLLAGDLAGLTVEGIFSPSTDETGAATLTVRSEYDMFEGSIAAHNYGSDAVGPWLADMELAFNSVLGQHERIILKGGVAAEFDELKVGEVEVSAPIGTEGTQLFGRVVVSDSKPGDGLQTFAIDSTGTRWSIGVKHPFIRSREENLFAGIRFDWDDLKSDSGTFGTLSDDHLRVIRGTVEYDFADAALGGPAVTAMQANVSAGLDAFGATGATDPFRSRTNADASFVSLAFQIERLQNLGSTPFSVLVGVKGQMANEALLASEEFGFGGMEYGRGFDPSTLVGDRGLAGKIELQYQGDPGGMSNFLDSYQLYAFVDAGVVENINFDGAGNNQSRNAWSAGGGIRLGLVKDVDIDLAVAYRGTDQSSVSNLGDDRWRALLKMEAHF